jgi:Ni/Co efflux regulator RcnB
MALTLKTTTLAIAVASLAITAPAMAQGRSGHAKKQHQQERSHDRDHDRDGGVDIHVDISLGDHERRVVRDYYSSRDSCPPGLAKKRNGCLPPGIAKKRYQIGRPVYDDAIIVELPHDIIVRLPPLQRGYGYRMVDGDLVVVALATMVVLDAIDVI